MSTPEAESTIHARTLPKPAPNGSTGAIYTPPVIADWVAEKLLRSLPDGAETVLDFAVGEGALLRAVANCSKGRLDLIGVDVDASALAVATRIPGVRTIRFDAIEASLSGRQGLLERSGVEKVDGVILNPPWGIELQVNRAQLHAVGYELASGQFDSADLFLEIAVKTLDPGGAAALVLPDSLFFPDRAPLRKFLLENCTIDLVARLGEGFFSGVFRGTAVVVLRRGVPSANHEVECVRLSPDDRARALSGDATLAEVAAKTVHFVPQARFSKEAGAFSIDLRQDDLRHVHAICRQRADWTITLTSGRGVELSKNGEIIRCSSCHRARPRPRSSALIHCVCGVVLDPATVAAEKIVRPARRKSGASWRNLIAGDDVGRYSCRSRREIRTGIVGINYKPDIDLSRPSLLVRKTGIGLKAAIFAGDALTTQTVFHYQATDESPTFLLSYALGVLCSRTLLAVHLKRTGELEWRSHPYVTQRLLAELPIPSPEPGTQKWKQAHAIADRVTLLDGDRVSITSDLAVESLVAGLYEMEPTDLDWVGRVLNEAQGLEGIASLRLPPGGNVTPVLVD